MPRIDDYITAKKLAVEKLAQLSLDKIIQQSGFAISEAAVISIPFLKRNYGVSYPDFEFVDASEPNKEVPIQEQVLILHYLMADKKAAGQLNAVPIETGDAGFEFHVFPKVPMQMILWVGDDEFPPEANILFDQTIGELLSPEDVAWLAGMVVYRLIALSR
jgi:hypothetical protein